MSTIVRLKGVNILPITSLDNTFSTPFRTHSFPLEPTSYALELMDQFFTHVMDKFYPCHIGISPAEAKYSWFHRVLTDEAAYHCIIAISEASIHLFRGGGVSSPEALYHRSQVLTIVNKRLKSDDALSDSTLGIITTLVIHEQIRRRELEAEIHFEGLKKMVELCGGLEKLVQMETLMKICKIDIIYALQYGSSTSFFRDSMPEARNKLAFRGVYFDLISAESSIRHSKQVTPYLRNILSDVVCAAPIFDANLMTNVLDVNTFQEIVYSICYRLIRFQPLRSIEELTTIDTVYHIGLTIFMMTLFLQHDKRRIMPYELIYIKLRTVLDRELDELDDGLILWTMFIGSIWIDTDPNRTWLFPKIRERTKRLGISSWDEIHNLIKDFPWIKVFHDKLGREIWDSISSEEE